MFCQNCGKEISSDSLFCPYCGTKQEKEQPKVEEESVNGQPAKRCVTCGALIPEDSDYCTECGSKQNGLSDKQPQNEPDQPNCDTKNTESRQDTKLPQNKELSPEEKEKRKNRNKIIGIIAIAFIIIGITIVVLLLTVKTTINLNDYISISAEGYDTAGTAVIEFDSDKFENDYEKKLSSAKKDGISSIEKYTDEDAYFEELIESLDDSSASNKFISSVVSWDISEQSGLSNGDVITFEWDCDDALALEVYGVKLKYEDIAYTVEGLEEVQTFDPFDGIDVSFSGIAPNGNVEINGTPTSNAAQDFSYEADKYEELSNGDKITVTAVMYYTDDIMQYCTEEYGMVPSTLTKEYTVEGLDSYVRTFSEVSESCLEEMQSQAEDVYKSKTVSDWGEGEELKGFDYIGNYFLTSKDNDGWNTENILYLVYKVTVNNKFSRDTDNYDEDNEFYWYISFSNLIVNKNGENSVDVTRYDTPHDRTYIDSGILEVGSFNKKWDYIGYQNPEDLYKAVITYNLDNYNLEDNTDEIIFPETYSENDASGDIFADSSDEIIDSDEIKELTDEELRYAINELYARHGYIFNDEELRAYYEQYDWYEEKIKPSEFSISLFNETEKKNVEALQKERDSRK